LTFFEKMEKARPDMDTKYCSQKIYEKGFYIIYR